MTPQAAEPGPTAARTELIDDTLSAALARERRMLERLQEAQAELADLRSVVLSWKQRPAMQLVSALSRAVRHVVAGIAPPGTAQRDTLGYARATAAMALRGTEKILARVVASDATTPEGLFDSSGGRAPAPLGDTGPDTTGTERPPFISVIVPVYNAERFDARYLKDALDSIEAQTYRAFEVIVVDDGSTDGTAAVVKRFMEAHPQLDMTLLDKPNGGQSSARNLGVRHAHGEWLAFLDQDDVWLPERLETVIPLLAKDVDLVYTDAETIDADDSLDCDGIHLRLGAGGKHPKTSPEDVLYADAFVMPGVMTMRRSLFERIGGFDEHLSGYEDDDLLLRAVQHGRVRYVPIATLRWRQYGGNYSRSSRMVDSRMYFWRKLMAKYTAQGTDRRAARRITVRFLSEFLTQCDLQVRDHDPLAADNLAAAHTLLVKLSPIDRAAYRLTTWAWSRRGAAAHYARVWFINGLRAGS